MAIRKQASEPGETLATVTLTTTAHGLPRPLPTVIERLRTQLRPALAWTVSQPNSAAVWGDVRRQIEDIVRVCRQDGELVGTTPQQAFFVRCDQTTMTQNDLDNGRLIALVGLAGRAAARRSGRASRRVTGRELIAAHRPVASGRGSFRCGRTAAPSRACHRPPPR